MTRRASPPSSGACWGVEPVRRALVGLTVAAAASAATAWTIPTLSPPAAGLRQARAAAPRSRASVPAFAVSLRAPGALATAEAHTLRHDVRTCARPPRRASCVLMALEHAGAGAKLNGVILTAIAAIPAAAGCRAALAALLAPMTTLAYLAVDGTRSTPWPAEVRADARAAARVAGAVIAAAAATRRLGDCAPRRAGPQLVA